MKTTKKDFETFRGFALEWQEKLGLKDWHLYFYHEQIGDSFADTTASPSGRCASIRFNTKWQDRETNDVELRECALHEVLHVMTAPVMNEARARFADEYALECEEHAIVTRLTNYIIEMGA